MANLCIIYVLFVGQFTFVFQDLNIVFKYTTAVQNKKSELPCFDVELINFLKATT